MSNFYRFDGPNRGEVTVRITENNENYDATFKGPDAEARAIVYQGIMAAGHVVDKDINRQADAALKHNSMLVSLPSLEELKKAVAADIIEHGRDVIETLNSDPAEQAAIIDRLQTDQGESPDRV